MALRFCDEMSQVRSVAAADNVSCVHDVVFVQDATVDGGPPPMLVADEAFIDFSHSHRMPDMQAQEPRIRSVASDWLWLGADMDVTLGASMDVSSVTAQWRPGLSKDQRDAWEQNGCFSIEGFVPRDMCRAMLERGLELARRPEAATALGVVTRYETDFSESLAPEERVSKLFRLQREPLFDEFCSRGDVLGLLSALVGPDVDVFLSQFVFKLPGSSGQPWHQDAVLFPFEPDRPVIGLWLAVTDAAVDNSCLSVVPGSHTRGVLPHTREEPGSNGRYLALTGPDVTCARPLPMRSGDLFVFDSHLVHGATDNRSNRLRVAATWHFAAAGTVDRTAEEFGHSPFNEWTPVLRSHGHP